MKARAALWRLAISAVITAVLLILLLSGMSRPIGTDTRIYTAQFTDASGLHEGADVRIRGVLVGRVESSALERLDDQSVASVKFSLAKRYGVVSNTRLAIKYQTLTGTRYVDVMHSAEGYSDANIVTEIPTTMTLPSFDVTALFNGLQPVIATLSPEDLNTFTENAANVLAGDSSGLGPMLDSIRKLTEFVADRQTVIATLMNNLSQISNVMGGHSKDVIQILDWLNRPDGPLDQALVVLDEFRKSQIFGPRFLEPTLGLLTNIGLPPGPDRFMPARDLDMAFDTAFNNLDNTIDAFKLIPTMWESIPPPSAAGEPAPCSRGVASLPTPMDVLLNGQRVILCNP